MAMSLADLTSIIFSALSSVITEPGLKPILLGGSAAACLRDLDRRIERQLARRDGAERDIGGHQLGQRGRIPALEGVLVLQHLAGVERRTGSPDWPGRPGQRRAGERQADQKPCRESPCRIINSEMASCRVLPVSP